MISKSDAQSDEVSKWWQITLLNDVYKIEAKTISIRLRCLLPSIIHDIWSSFIQDRSIFYFIFVLKMVVLNQQNKPQLVVLLLNFEKAYDKRNWDFLELV